jgi:subtilisin-like proprotein convertase family protein
MQEEGNTLAAETLPTLTVADTTLTEPDTGSTLATFTVSLSAASTRDVSFSYTTANDLALASVDYAGATGRIVIPAGSTSASFTISVLGDTFFEPRETYIVRLYDPVNATIARGTGFGMIEDNDKPDSLDVPLDRHFVWQWSLFSRYGINVLPTWRDYTGDGVRVAVFDQGIDASHPDLDGNFERVLSRDAATLTGTGLPRVSSDNHGTALAGVIAAELDGAGMVGVAYGAELFSIYSPLNESTAVFGSRVANAYDYARAAKADVVNDSWGFGNYFMYGPNYAFVDDFGTAAYATAGLALHNLAKSGRDGLGTVVVQSAGNTYAYGDDTNLHSFQNSRYIVTVAASDYFGSVSSYSSPGASILVTAPGGESGGASGLVATDRVGSEGYSTSDYVFVAGTSFSSAVASGVAALILDANRLLGYRDVQEILAYSALRPPSDGSQWTFNGASNWNGGGLHFNTGVHRYGYGLIDATAAVRLAETWQGQHTLANLQELKISQAPATAIRDDDAAGVTNSAFVGSHMQVERVDVMLNVTHSFIGDLVVKLRSPSGISSVLIDRPGQMSSAPDGSSQQNIHFTLDSVAYWGEDAYGDWTLHVSDQGRFGTGTFDSWTLNVMGKPVSPDSVYVYTNEYADTLRVDATRETLEDSGGNDTLNAAAVTTASTIDLTPGADSRVAGSPLVIGIDTVIENAIGGDGSDRILGNAAGNTLRGMRGDDWLFGGDGDDVLDGGNGNDTLDGRDGMDTAVFTSKRAEAIIVRTSLGFSVRDTVSERDGTDALLDVERMQFADMNVALDLAAGQSAGNTVRLIGAAFDSPYIEEYAGVGINLFDAGFSMLQVAQAAVNTGLFLSLAASASNVSFVDTVYRNVVGTLPSSDEHDFYVGLLQGSGGSMTQAELLVLAANSQPNEINIGLVGLQQNGVEFV